MAFRGNWNRIFCVVAALLFSISAVAHSFAMTQPAMKMSSAPAEMSMQGHGMDHGMDCGGDDLASKVNCIAACATAIAILSEPVRMLLPLSVRGADPEAPLPMSGRGLLPEPHPPKRLT
jgi:hypothetical protein